MGEFNACQLEEDDFAETAGLLSMVFGGTAEHWLQLFAHWWAANPAWSSRIPRGWIIRSADGAVIAHTANVPFYYIIDGNRGICCATGSTVVHPDWQGRGLSKLIALPFMNQIDADLVVGVGSTHVAHKLWLSIGMKSLEGKWPKVSHALIGSLPDWAENKLGGTWAGPLCRGLGGAVQYLAKAPIYIRSRPRSISVERVERFETKDATAIEKCRASDASTFAVRDISILNWLYFGSNYVRKTRVMFAARSGSRLVGYFAMKRTEDTFYMLECRCLDSNPEIAKELLLAARDYAEHERASYIRVWSYAPMLEQALPRYISIPTNQPPMMTYCYFSRTHEKEPANWETTPGDGDLSIY
jgi:GNAT superfamily N-acetyltransferase